MKVSKEIKKHVHVLTGTWIERERGAVDRVEEREEGHGEVKSRTERALGEGQR